MKLFILALLSLGLTGGVSAAPDSQGTLEVEIQKPSPGLVVPNSETWIDVEGDASTFGGVKELDLFLVMDTSSSLRDSDPDDHRLAGATQLVESLPARSDTRIGIVEFDGSSELVLPLTSNRNRVIDALRNLDRSGSTDLAGGIQSALSGLEGGGRPAALRMMLLFTDGKSKRMSAFKTAHAREGRAVRSAMEQAMDQGVAIHSLLLGSDSRGARLLQEIATETGGSFVQVTDPRSLPEAFLNLRTAGVDHVSVQVGDAEPVRARLIGSAFSARVPVHEGVNEIVATATSLHGTTSHRTTSVTVRAPGCGELHVAAQLDGNPALSISDRGVEVVIDASLSMWGRMQGRPKMEIAKETVDMALDWLPEDLDVSLRAYGNRHAREQYDCQDSELLVPLRRNNRDEIREAVAGLRPNGQTPLAFAIGQIGADLGDYPGERAVVLVTDGIESCGGDPVAAAQALQAHGPIPVHVIGFGLGDDADEDIQSLRSIAAVSGGHFVTADSAEELRGALSVMVGTAFQVWRGERPVARGALGSAERILLPGGNYVVQLESFPPQELPIRLASEEQLRLVFDREQGKVSHREQRESLTYTACRAVTGFDDPVLTTAAEPAAPIVTNVQATMDDRAAPAEIDLPAPASPSPNVLDGSEVRVLQLEESEEPDALRVDLIEIPGGSVEIWQYLQTESGEADWGVVVRHPRRNQGAETVWRGQDLQRARMVQGLMGRLGVASSRQP